MSFGAILYKILIGPLELFFEVVFVVAERHVNNPAYAIIFLSLAMNLLVLPLYRRADAVQAEERDRENALAPWIKHIKKTFKGDERFMMLQAFYKENNYKPTDSLKGSVSLLLEIPFFIAAYHFLSNLQTIRGVSFGPIADLGAPDGLLIIGTLTLNFLPILMTLINVVSAAIYMKGFPLKSKVQMYGIAVIFLIFLYKSPAGLVFYWTLNNLFSLFKNIFYKIPNAKQLLYYGSICATALLLVLVLFLYPMRSTRSQIIVVAGLLMLLAGLIFSRRGNLKPPQNSIKECNSLFFEGTLLLAVLTGMLIPTAIIADSPLEFIDVNNYYSPIWHFIATMCLSAGTFLVWFRIFYSLADHRGKNIFAKLIWITAGIFVVDYFFFGREYGNFSTEFQFDEPIKISSKEIFLNLLIIAAIVAVAMLLWKKISLVRTVYLASCLALVIMSGVNIVGIIQALSPVEAIVEQANKTEPEITLSKTGRNVVVLMLDRAASIYVPYLFEEKPELKEKMAGFTFYPNAVSYGTSTNVGAPGIYGGYDYIPINMNKRDNVSIPEKNDEALKLMPALFSANNAKVTVSDPTYAGYSWIPDLSIFDEYQDVKTFISMGKFDIDEYDFESYGEFIQELRNRNFFCYSIFKVSPLIFQPTLYDKGNYNNTKALNTASNSVGAQAAAQTRDGLSIAYGYEERFMNSYAVLYHLPDITKIEDSDQDTFLMMSNDTTHQPSLLQEPEYEPSMFVDNTQFDKEHQTRKSWDGKSIELSSETQITHYQINMAAFLQLGKWFDYLKEQGVYDNTRIILVSDHSWQLWQDKNTQMTVDVMGDGNTRPFDLCAFNCLLMVKDFASEEFSEDDTFMTNADTPSIAMDGLIEDPVNPFTGNPIRKLLPSEKDTHLIFTQNWQTTDNQGMTFLPDRWFTVHDNIFDINNWEYLGYY